MARKASNPRPDYVVRGVYVDRALGLVRAVTSHGKQIALRMVTSEEEIDTEAADLQRRLDEVDPIPRHAFSVPSHLRLIR